MRLDRLFTKNVYVMPLNWCDRWLVITLSLPGYFRLCRRLFGWRRALINICQLLGE